MARTLQIQVLRGTLSQVQAANNFAGEPLFATDTKELFLSDGTTKHLIGAVDADTVANRPTAGVNGRMFYATDEDRLYRDNGSTWDLISSTQLSDLDGDLDDISDGATYGKVLGTELSSGQVIRLRAVTGAVNVSGDQINTHINDSTIHFVIDDASPGPNKAYSSQKIEAELAAVVSGMIRQPAVIDRLVTPPGSPSTGDRYIVAPSATGAWAGQDNDIAVWGGSAWTFTTPAEGWIVYNDASDTDWLAVDDGGLEWEERTVGVSAHNDLSGLNDGDYKHLTALEYTAATEDAGNGNGSGLMSDTDKTKLDGIDSGAQVNQDITAQGGLVRTDANASNGDAVIEADFEDSNANIQGLQFSTTGVAGTSDKVARADHKHPLFLLDAGTL